MTQPDTLRVNGRSFDVEHHSTDVLVVGGGLAGCWSAYRASEIGEHVTLVDKSRAGAGGVSPFAGAVILCMRPDDDLDAFLEEQRHDACDLNDSEWVRSLIADNYERIQQLDSWGAPMERDEDGNIARRKIDIGSRKTVYRLHWESVEFMKFFYRHLKKLSHQRKLNFQQQTPIVKLLKENGRVTGAVGLDRHEETVRVFSANSVVLSAGGCTFKGNHFAVDSVCGESYDMALDAGASLCNMEFSNGYIATCREFNTHGQSVLAAVGGKYVNADGEEFLHRYSDDVPAPPPVVCRAMAQEVKEGRGPIYYDLREVDEDCVDNFKETFPLIQRGADRKGIDLFDEPTEWNPGMTGTVGGSGGIQVRDQSMATDVPGLYVAGDAATKSPVIGAGSGITFMNLAWANTTGYWAGEGAALHSRKQDPPEDSSDPGAVRTVLEPLENDGDLSTDDAYEALQDKVMPAELTLVREKEPIQSAVEDLRKLFRRDLSQVNVDSLRDLSEFYELRASLRTALAMHESALFREESRGWHYRTDHPERDDENWSCWTNLREDGDELSYHLGKTTPSPDRSTTAVGH